MRAGRIRNPSKVRIVGVTDAAAHIVIESRDVMIPALDHLPAMKLHSCPNVEGWLCSWELLPFRLTAATGRETISTMRVPLQQEILEILKQKLLPEIAEIKADIVQIKADIRVINSRLDQLDKRFDEVDKRFDKVDEETRDLKNDVREVRSYVFTSHLSEKTYSAVREK